MNDFQQAVELAKNYQLRNVISRRNQLKGSSGRVLHKSIKEIISVQEERVRVIIIKYRDIIEQAAQYLLEKERISGKYLRELLSRDKKNEVGDENI